VPVGAGSPSGLSDDPNAQEFDPAWSPSAAKLAYSLLRNGSGSRELRTVNADNTGDLLVTSPSFSDEWSPDGTKIVFSTGANVYVINPNGTGQTQVTSSGGLDPDWQSVVTGYPRPKSASPIRVPLVPAYNACSTPNRTHGPPLAFDSCSPPVQTSPNLTVGTPDANGAAANSVSYVHIRPYPGVPGPPEDSGAPIMMWLNDVRCQGAVATCGSANAAGGADYTGEVRLEFVLRMTDKWNAVAPGGGLDAATVTDFTFLAPTTCTATSSTAEGSLCRIVTDANYLYPGLIKDTKRTVWEFDQVRVVDGGPDGDVDTPDNSPFAVQGLFVP
jgi:hypothetical protein